MPTNGWDLAPVKLEPGQKERWKEAAAGLGLSLAAYVRQCVEDDVALRASIKREDERKHRAWQVGLRQNEARAGV